MHGNFKCSLLMVKRVEMCSECLLFSTGCFLCAFWMQHDQNPDFMEELLYRRWTPSTGTWYRMWQDCYFYTYEWNISSPVTILWLIPSPNCYISYTSQVKEMNIILHKTLTEFYKNLSAIILRCTSGKGLPEIQWQVPSLVT